MRRVAYVLILLLVASLPLAAAGEAYRKELQIGNNDSLKIVSDIPDIIIDRNNSKNRIDVSLVGPNTTRFRMDIKESGDGVVIEVKKKFVFGVDLMDVFGTELTISLPHDLSYREVEIASVSGEVSLEMPLKAHSISLETVSGKISFENLAATDDVDLKSVSGAIVGSTVEAGDLSVEQVSGALRLESVRVQDDDVEISSISGSIEIGMFDTLEAEVRTISGFIDLKLPSSFDGVVQTSTISGRVENLTRSVQSETEGKTNRSTLGNGRGMIVLSTTSGSIHIAQ
jgi:hypothetical protein